MRNAEQRTGFAVNEGSSAGNLRRKRRLVAVTAAVLGAVAVVVSVGSLAGPLGGSGVGDGNRLALVAMHIIAAAVLIPMLYRTSPRAVPRAATAGGSAA